MALLDDPGDLSEVPLAAVLIEALNERATGVLTVEHTKGASRLFLQEGVPAGAQSFVGFKPLGETLLAKGVIDVDTLGRSLAEMARTRRPQGEVLVAMGAATQEQVDAALSEQQSTYLAHMASLGAGRYRFERAEALPNWTEAIRISPLRAIVEALEKPQSLKLVASALQPVAQGAIALAPGYRQVSEAFGWSPPEAALVERLQNLTTLDAFLERPGVPPERARAILAALLLLGLALPRSAPSGLDAPVPGVVVDIDDLDGEPVACDVLENEPAAATTRSPPGEVAAAAKPAGRRSDPGEARARRQRLLVRAMQNMGVGPLSGVPPPAAARKRPAGAQQEPLAASPDRARPPPTAEERELRRLLAAAAPRAAASDLFERLGVSRGASREQVKSAYLQLAKGLHPDRFASPALADVAAEVKNLFAAVNEAYAVLSDDRKRAEYLERTGGKPSAGASAEVELQKAEACARTRDWVRARQYYESALSADPRPEIKAAFAWALLQEPDPDRERARALAEAASRAAHPPDRADVVCGLLAKEAGDDEKAERFLRRALKTNPRNPDAVRELKALEARRPKKKPGGLTAFFRKR